MNNNLDIAFWSLLILANMYRLEDYDNMSIIFFGASLIVLLINILLKLK